VRSAYGARERRINGSSVLSANSNNPRGLDVARAVLGIAQVIERVGFVETIREFPV